MGTRDVWLFLFMLGVPAFGWPLPAVFEAHAAAYVFTAWAAFIALIFLFSRKAQTGGGG